MLDEVARQMTGDLARAGAASNARCAEGQPRRSCASSAARSTREPVADPALDGAFGLVEHPRDGAVTVAAEIRELDRAPFLVG